jgi:hypothetical protein
MLIYHPALDPYHSAFRILHLLAYDPKRYYDRRAICVLDFYAVFPQLIPTVRLPNQHARWRRLFSGRENPYWFNGDRRLVFGQMRPLQETALDLLYAQGLIDNLQYSDGFVQIVLDEFRRVNLSEPSPPAGEVLEFLVTVLGTFPFHGVGGLKDRTGLLEYRYDTA